MTLFTHLGHWQIDFVTFGLLLASTVFTLIPEELLFVTLGFLAHFGRIHPIEAILAAQFGLIPADFLTVFLGRKLGKGIFARRPFCYLFGEQAVHHSLEKLRTSGGALLFFTRFTPMLRTPVYLAAGISGFSLRKAFLIDVLAACIQVPAFFLLGFISGEAAERFVSLFTYIVVGVAFVFLLKSIVTSLILSRRNRIQDRSNLAGAPRQSVA